MFSIFLCKQGQPRSQIFTKNRLLRYAIYRRNDTRILPGHWLGGYNSRPRPGFQVMRKPISCEFSGPRLALFIIKSRDLVFSIFLCKQGQPRSQNFTKNRLIRYAIYRRNDTRILPGHWLGGYNSRPRAGFQKKRKPISCEFSGPRLALFFIKSLDLVFSIFL